MGGIGQDTHGLRHGLTCFAPLGLFGKEGGGVSLPGAYATRLLPFGPLGLREETRRRVGGVTGGVG